MLMRGLNLRPMRRTGEEVGPYKLALPRLSIGGEMAVRAERFLRWVAHPTLADDNSSRLHTGSP